MPAAADFEAPGPGQWALDRSHFPGGTTRYSGEPHPGRTRGRFMYTSVVPLLGGDRQPGRLPPNIVLKAAGALEIPDGATVTVDPVAGRVIVEVS